MNLALTTERTRRMHGEHRVLIVCLFSLCSLRLLCDLSGKTFNRFVT